MNLNEPLGMPRGTVRAILAYTMVGAYVFGFILCAVALVKSGQWEKAVQLVLAFGAGAGPILGFYFGARNGGTGK